MRTPNSDAVKGITFDSLLKAPVWHPDKHTKGDAALLKGCKCDMLHLDTIFAQARLAQESMSPVVRWAADVLADDSRRCWWAEPPTKDDVYEDFTNTGATAKNVFWRDLLPKVLPYDIRVNKTRRGAGRVLFAPREECRKRFCRQFPGWCF